MGANTGLIKAWGEKHEVTFKNPNFRIKGAISRFFFLFFPFLQPTKPLFPFFIVFLQIKADFVDSKADLTRNLKVENHHWSHRTTSDRKEEGAGHRASSSPT